MTYQSEEDLYRSEEQEEDTDPVMVGSRFDSDLTETRTKQTTNDENGEEDEDGVLEVGRAHFWEGLSICVVLDLDHTRSECLWWAVFCLFVFTSRPHQLHQFIFDKLGTLDEVVNIIIPNDKKSLVSDESSRLELSGGRQILHAWKNLDTKTVGQWNIDGVRRPGEEGFDDTRVDSHGALEMVSEGSKW